MQSELFNPQKFDNSRKYLCKWVEGKRAVMSAVTDVTSDTTSIYSSGSVPDGCGELETTLEGLRALLGNMLEGIEVMETKLQSIQRPIQNIYTDQLGDVPFLETSPFRNASFHIKAPGFPGVDLTKRYKFKDITALLRAYLEKKKAIDASGLITLPRQLKTLFGIKTNTATFMELISKLRTILV